MEIIIKEIPKEKNQIVMVQPEESIKALFEDKVTSTRLKLIRPKPSVQIVWKGSTKPILPKFPENITKLFDTIWELHSNREKCILTAFTKTIDVKIGNTKKLQERYYSLIEYNDKKLKLVLESGMEKCRKNWLLRWKKELDIIQKIYNTNIDDPEELLDLVLEKNKEPKDDNVKILETIVMEEEINEIDIIHTLNLEYQLRIQSLHLLQSEMETKMNFIVQDDISKEKIKLVNEEDLFFRSIKKEVSAELTLFDQKLKQLEQDVCNAYKVSGMHIKDQLMKMRTVIDQNLSQQRALMYKSAIQSL